jgi:hypothetical protein
LKLRLFGNKQRGRTLLRRYRLLQCRHLAHPLALHLFHPLHRLLRLLLLLLRVRSQRRIFGRKAQNVRLRVTQSLLA